LTVPNGSLGARTVVQIAKPADPGSVKGAFSRADSYLQDVSNKGGGQRNQVTTGTSGAVNSMPPHVSKAQQMITDVALMPLKLLGQSMLDLLSHPEHIFDPTAQVDQDIAQIQSQVSQLFDNMTSEITTEANGRLQAIQPTLNVMQDESGTAKAVTDAMQKLQGSGSQADLDALNKLLPAQSAPWMHVVQGTTLVLPNAISLPHDTVAGALAKSLPQNIPATQRHKGEIVTIASNWSGIKAQVGTPTHTNPAHQQYVDQQFAQLRGKSPADIQKQKQAWIEEAKRRFAGHPRVLQKVLEYIEAHTKG
jgi:hypothetical protein